VSPRSSVGSGLTWASSRTPPGFGTRAPRKHCRLPSEQCLAFVWNNDAGAQVSDETTRYLVEHVVSNVLGFHVAVYEGGRVRRDVVCLRHGGMPSALGADGAALRGQRDAASR